MTDCRKLYHSQKIYELIYRVAYKYHTGDIQRDGEGQRGEAGSVSDGVRRLAPETGRVEEVARLGRHGDLPRDTALERVIYNRARDTRVL